MQITDCQCASMHIQYRQPEREQKYALCLKGSPQMGGKQEDLWELLTNHYTFAVCDSRVGRFSH